MEIRKDSLSTVKLCRFCLSQDSQDLRCLYDRSGGRARNNASLSTKILSAVTVEVFPSDKMPSYICSRCSHFMDICYEYKQVCRNADESIFQYVQTGSSLKSIAWPALLTKSYESAKCGSVGSVMKTVVEGGTTVEVSSQDISDEDGDEDDENVYKIKIGDGKEEARIKVITGDASKKPKKDWSPAPRGALDGRFACDQCTCTYPLQQLLQLHKLQKHRERSFNCSLCDAKFYSKYDLSAHKMRHTDVKPFECVVCDAKFKKMSLLKRHEKLVHSDLPQSKCPFPDCRMTTLSNEELKRHLKDHVERLNKKGERNYACDQCDKRFYERSSLQRHVLTGHNTQEWSCEYCTERFSSVSKLTRHVRTHAGERPYPCKYCTKTFMKSHHYTRHVRLKHADMLESSFRCDQCGSSFVTQDDLMYHSAIHATQDLTCPLCHEKFENVDGVTAHIKSHVNGMEFMCDYCELVFTSKHKLDSHTATAHEDEVHNDRASQDESSMEADPEDEDDTFNVKQEGDHMVVEIKKPGSFILSDSKGEIDYRPETDNTGSEESETEMNYADSADSVTMASPTPVAPAPVKSMPVEAKPATAVSDKGNDNKLTASILRKAEEVKKKLHKQTTPATTNKKEEKPVAKVEPNNSGGNDKSLKLLEKELQELQRTNTRQDASKTPAKPAEPARNNRRPQLNSSTPKLRPVNEKKAAPATPKTPVEKKVPERRAIKENKEPKEVKTPVIAKEDKEAKEVKTPVNAKAEKEKANNTNAKEEKEKETKEKDTPKSAVKNGTSDTSTEDVRRSARPSKVKDYAKLAQEKVKEGSDNDDSDDADDEEYAEDSRPKGRRGSGKKPAVKAPPRKRGRPRKIPSEVPPKVRKQETEEEEEKSELEEAEESKKDETPQQEANGAEKTEASSQSQVLDTSDQAHTEQKADVMKSPMGHTLKKVPIKSLPPGVKPLPLPTNARPMGSGNISEMQIGKKMVKVQKIVMTKAEVEAMAKKGLLEMKDGTMVLKQGIKLPTSDPNSIKSSLVGEESPAKKSAPTPTRCDIDDNVTN